MNVKRTITGATVALFALVATASGTAADSNEVPEATKAFWKKECARCHAEDGSGRTKMGRTLKIIDYTDPKVQKELKKEEMVKTIKEGNEVKGKQQMKPYADQMNEQDIENMIRYIRSFAKPE